MRATLARLALALIVLNAGWVPARPVAAAPELERWGFYVTDDPTSRESLLAHLGQLDRVAPAYFSLNAAGGIDGSDDAGLDWRVRAAGIGIFPLVKNRPTDAALRPFLVDPARRAALVATLAALAARDRFDGLTLDLEGVDPGDRDDLSALVRDLALALHRSGRQLAVAVPAKTGDQTRGWAGAYDDRAIGTAADRVILMAYAYRTAQGQPGPISPFPWVVGATAYERSQVPASRLVLGIGTWGYDWDLSHPGPATGDRYAQVAALVGRFGGLPTYDTADHAVRYRYVASGDAHEVWYEDAASAQAKIALASRDDLAGVALWRLGEEAPGVWDDLRVAGRADFAIPRGWFFAETGGDTGFGYAVSDAAEPFWREFERLGGVATLGYPVSRRFVGPDGFTYQAFQRGVLQWRPERGEAVPVNTFEELTRAGQDPALAAQGIPPPIADDGSGGDWQRARATRLGWLTNPAIARAFYANPNPRAVPAWSVDDSIRLYGLPASAPVRAGPFVVQRFQRVSLQLWLAAVPGMPAPGTVVGILGGDLYMQAGLIPTSAAQPEAPFS